MHFSVNAIDLILLFFLIPGLIGGLIKGLMRQAAALVALVVGVWFALRFSTVLAALFKVWFETESSAIELIAFAVIFFLTLFFINIAGKILARLLKIVLLGWLDKLLGMVFGLLKYALIASVIIFLLTSLDSVYPFLPQEMLKNSTLFPMIRDFAPAIFSSFKNIA